MPEEKPSLMPIQSMTQRINMKKYLPHLCTILSAIFFATTASAADSYKLDSNHVSVNWSANHFGFSSPSGKFTDADGVIILDEKSPQNSSVDVTIKISSLSTGLLKFDEHLKSKDFFDIERFPTAKFVSSSVTLVGKNGAKISGNLTLHGVTNRVTLDAKLNKIGIGPFTQKKMVGFSATTAIKRSQFGMSFGLPGVSDNVKLSIEAEGIIVDSAEKSPIVREWKIIPSKSKIEFKASQDKTDISGSFKKFSGKINFDSSQLQSSTVQIEIDTTSVDTTFSEAADVIQGAVWLATKAFPTAIFKSEKFTALPDKKSFRSNGTLTIKGKTLPVVLDFTLKEYSTTNAHAVGSAVIKRSAFGIGENDHKKANGVKDDVIVTIDVAAER